MGTASDALHQLPRLSAGTIHFPVSCYQRPAHRLFRVVTCHRGGRDVTEHSLTKQFVARICARRSPSGLTATEARLSRVTRGGLDRLRQLLTEPLYQLWIRCFHHHANHGLSAGGTKHDPPTVCQLSFGDAQSTLDTR
jgi:hypothetical protein